MTILSREDIPEILKEKIRIVKSFFSGKKILVAFSGGIDSTLVLFFAKKFGKEVKGVFIYSPLTPTQEINQAKQFSTLLNIPITIYTLNSLQIREIRENLPNRCYHCKKRILDILIEIAKHDGHDLVIDGTNFSDLGLHRPGLLALKESNVQSPLAEGKFTKSDIITLTQILSLPSRNISSQACLASRIPYNTEITVDLLNKIDKAEIFLRTLIKNTTVPLRVRIHKLLPSDLLLARIESDARLIELINNRGIREDVNSNLKKMGFAFVTIDLSGFSSGSMDKIVKL
ncbi:ATP-dependent sacrificial sulfur transferase LarE [Promethearchaeum syntrophicum]|uniref:ATP-dependent sacrificial sulfur transferase LarE n=1 Tax=Promethearchaeum syntrophicum TaxID=2594042 RepID=A0A5B9D584_9ARCH|nr:ATP-dependent sacrificial sulfur transferase LarE [Candidatus Prometheoarchaeum syntrophicum]QEE14212.1 tRNA-specific 2-thiouridylase MnmA [Candidatus Prometheoarchaeum syntrophicum]